MLVASSTVWTPSPCFSSRLSQEFLGRERGISTFRTEVSSTVPQVYELFPLKEAVKIEGHRLPLLAVQGTASRRDLRWVRSLNHVVFDKSCLWFFNSWTEICWGAETISVGGSSPLFRMYENDFGWGAPVEPCSGDWTR